MMRSMFAAIASSLLLCATAHAGNVRLRVQSGFNQNVPVIGENIALEDCRMFALRGLKSAEPNTVSIYDDYSPDTRVDSPLRSVRDGGAKELSYEIHHPKFNSSEAVLLIYGRFHDGKGGLADNAPIRISPPSKWNTDVIVDVGRKQLSLVKQD